MPKELKVIPVTVGGRFLFTIELLDERPEGFSACVPELGIYTFGNTEEQVLRRVHKHVVEKYQDLLNSPTPLNENEEAYLRHYRTEIVPALVEAVPSDGHTLGHPPMEKSDEDGRLWHENTRATLSTMGHKYSADYF